MVSIIIPCYNASKYICKAIDSALKQKVEKEIIIIDDCSTDNTREIVKKYLETGSIHIVCNSVNKGVAESRNSGVQMAKGEYIAFLDADDYWEEDKLERQLEELKKKKGVFCYTGRILVTENGEKTKKTISTKEVNTYKTLCMHNDISCSSVLIERKVALEFPMEHDEVHEDYLTWLRV
ncbi:MAG: glycosyltransferase family A protein, partial [Acetivibrio sp.]